MPARVTLVGKAGRVQYAYSGAPEPVALEQDEAGRVLLVELSIVDGVRRVSVAQQQVGRTRFEKLDVLAGSIVSQSALVADLSRRADPDLILDVRLTGVRPDELELVTAEVEAALAGSFLKIRVRDRSVASLGDGPARTALLGRLGSAAADCLARAIARAVHVSQQTAPAQSMTI